MSMLDIAFELWFGTSGQPEAQRSVYRTSIFDPMVAQGQLSDGMVRAFQYAAIIFRLAGKGAFARSPVSWVN